ncbi:hypothetical protein TSMEX_008937 [Taenia solium]|eukprot:TsM_000363400 transcript=TsM_000363400 gene=TsM_000363400
MSYECVSDVGLLCSLFLSSYIFVMTMNVAVGSILQLMCLVWTLTEFADLCVDCACAAAEGALWASTLSLLNVSEYISIVFGLTDVAFEGFVRVRSLWDGFACGTALVELCYSPSSPIGIRGQAVVPLVVGGQQYVAVEEVLVRSGLERVDGCIDGCFPM